MQFTTNRMRDFLWQIISSKFLACFEDIIENLSSVNIDQAENIYENLLTLDHDSLFVFPNGPYGRNTTLAGITKFLKGYHSKEYLVTALGRRLGTDDSRPSQFWGLHLSHGSRNSVGFTQQSSYILQQHLENVVNAEAMICHNHPRTLFADVISSMIEWQPLPSNADRIIASNISLRAKLHSFLNGEFRQVRFYLVESGQLARFHLPPIPISVLDWATNKLRTSIL